MSGLLGYVYAGIVTSAWALVLSVICSPAVRHLWGWRPSFLQKLSRWGLVAALFVAPCFYAVNPPDALTVASGQTASPTRDGAGELVGRLVPGAISPASFLSGLDPWRMTHAWAPWIVVGLLGSVGYYLALYWLGFRRLSRIVRGGIEIRRIGRVCLVLSETVGSPFAWHDFRVAYVVVPSRLLDQPIFFSLAVRHEIQHHRQRDTLWCHVMALVGAAYFWNPLIRMLADRMGDIQEMTCDESLTGRKGVTLQAYSHCLVTVAEWSLACEAPTAGGARWRRLLRGVAFSGSGRKLKRRIEMLQNYGRTGKLRMFALAAAAGIAVTATAAWASRLTVQDRVISLEEAEKLSAYRQTPDFPQDLNEAVLARLNLYLGTGRGREFVRRALLAKQGLDAVLQAKIRAHGLPPELLAVAFVESGFVNLPQGGPPTRSAGLWQFIPQTARNFGLRVDGAVDERLDEELATDAACRYLAKLYLRFQDWRLAVLAYNMGEVRLQAAIDSTGERDPWALIAAGHEGDAGYLARVMAGVLILNAQGMVPDLH